MLKAEHSKPTLISQPHQQAAEVLGLQSLSNYCQRRLGDLSDSLRIWRFEEVVVANSQSRCVLILDGMVLDVTRWLPQVGV